MVKVLAFLLLWRLFGNPFLCHYRIARRVLSIRWTITSSIVKPIAALAAHSTTSAAGAYESE